MPGENIAQVLIKDKKKNGKTAHFSTELVRKLTLKEFRPLKLLVQ